MAKKATQTNPSSEQAPQLVRIKLLARDRATEARILDELKRAARDLHDFTVELVTDRRDESDVVLIDPGLRGFEEALGERRGGAIYLLVDESERAPLALEQGWADDVLVYPIRPLELHSRLRQLQNRKLWDEVTRLNASFSETLSRLRDDVELAQRIQKSKLPSRFPELKGFKTAHRYLAGMRSGGDHFDLAESKDGAWLSFVLADSSSYGLSSAVLTVLMKVMMKLSLTEARSSAETVAKIHEELALTLKEKDRLSLFYATLSRKDYRLRYVNLGNSSAYYAGAGGAFSVLASQLEPISLKRFAQPLEREIALEPGSRLALISDGFAEALGGEVEVRRALDAHRKGDPTDTLNELVFRLRSKFTEEDDMPAQDCTAAIFDVDAKVLRLAKGE